MSFFQGCHLIIQSGVDSDFYRMVHVKIIRQNADSFFDFLSHNFNFSFKNLTFYNFSIMTNSVMLQSDEKRKEK